MGKGGLQGSERPWSNSLLHQVLEKGLTSLRNRLTTTRQEYINQNGVP